MISDLVAEANQVPSKTFSLRNLFIFSPLSSVLCKSLPFTSLNALQGLLTLIPSECILNSRKKRLSLQGLRFFSKREKNRKSKKHNKEKL